jgi:hypothetical protein
MFSGLTTFVSKVIFYILFIVMLILILVVDRHYLYELGYKQCITDVALKNLEKEHENAKVKNKIEGDVKGLSPNDLDDLLRKYYIPPNNA